MKSLRQHASPRLCPRPLASGLSLIELMVSLALGLIVTGSALTLFLTNKQTFTATESLGRVQENARTAFELMARDLRRAGGNPCDSRFSPANGLVDPDANWWSNWGNGLQSGILGYDDDQGFPDDAFGTAEGNRVDGNADVDGDGVLDVSDAIEIKSASSPPGGSIVTTALATPGGAIEVSSVAGLATGDLLVACNFVNASLFHATGFSGNNIQHVAGASAWGNGDPPGIEVAGDLASLPAATSADYAENSVVAIVHASRWYVGCNGRPVDDPDCDAPVGRSLYRASLVNDAGTPDVALDEVAVGVIGMQLTYLTDGATNYVPADSLTTTDWNDLEISPVVAVRVALTLAGDDRVGADGAVVQRTLTHTVAFRNRSP